MAEESKEGAKAFVESTPRGYIVLAKEWDADAPTHFVEIANFGHRLGEALDFRDSIRHGDIGARKLRRLAKNLHGYTSPKYRYTEVDGVKRLMTTNQRVTYENGVAVKTEYDDD